MRALKKFLEAVEAEGNDNQRKSASKCIENWKALKYNIKHSKRQKGSMVTSNSSGNININQPTNDVTIYYHEDSESDSTISSTGKKVHAHRKKRAYLVGDYDDSDAEILAEEKWMIGNENATHIVKDFKSRSIRLDQGKNPLSNARIL
ncbi:hypothetical protein BCV72DRAFT_334614 [Rhizopus microsporus var. microsporus]|uniref:Uncharacterized protein n=1 Tax=Rhizopus microsporus var. microsporus TaxID=86635 RepID=A0A1X0R8K2_RHIZD|nr:hypothetical protein BCV72DRAFT_334614 [Rhizopus microsporus var. microsporus]